MQNTFRINVDLKKETYMEEPVVTQNDAITFLISVFDNGAPFSLSEVTTATLAHTRLDGVTVVRKGTKIDDNTIQFTLDIEETRVPGRVSATVQLYDADERVSAIRFTYTVLKDPTGNGYIPTEREQTLIETVLGEGPLVIQQAQDAAAYAQEQGDYAKQVANENKTRWLTAVNTYADIATTYPNPQLGDTVQTIDDSKIYRWDGTQWVWTQQYNANAITDVQNKIGILSELETINKTSLVGAVNEIVTNLSDTSSRITTVPAYNLTLDNLRKWRKAIGKVKAGTGFAKLLVVADSTGWGLGAGGADGNAWPKILANDLNKIYPTQYSFIVPPSTANTGSDNDDRWSPGTGWVKTSWGFGGQACWQANSGVTEPLTVIPGIECDTLDVWYLRNSGLGSISISVDGGSPVVVSTAGSPLGWAKTTVTFPTGSNHVITITPSGNTVFILGCEAYLSTKPSIRLYNASVPDSRAYKSSGGWSDSSAGKSLEGISSIAPDLTIIMLGVNDARIAPTSTVDQWDAAIRAIIARAKISGDVILASVIPTSTGITGAFDLEKAYRDRGLIIASELGCVFVDILERYKDWNTANAAGFMYDALHLTAEGSGDVADAFRVVLTR